MNTLPTRAESPDTLDRLLTDFFKSQLKQPWPNAPATFVTATEPSAQVATGPRDQIRPHITRDNTARARFTLAASVVLLLGTCWYLSNGFQPGRSPGAGAPNLPPVPKLLPRSLSDGDKHPPLQEMEKDKAKGVGAPRIDLSKSE